MTKLLKYDDMKIELMQSTPYPAAITALAMSITMRRDPESQLPDFSQKTAEFILDAEHDSVLEHVVYTFLITGPSRSWLAQTTRQRMASPTSGSQQYQEYSEYPCAVIGTLTDEQRQVTQEALDHAYDSYSKLISLGLIQEEARQVLPNAATVSFLWTINARSLAKFLRLRLCNRNVKEMRIFASRVLTLVREHFPELFNSVGPQCYRGACKQGRMRCVEGEWINE